MKNLATALESYVTSDFYLACFLKASGMKLREPQRDGRRTLFVFEDRQDREDLIRAFYNDGRINVSAFTHAIQDLKAVIYNW